ncbi:hypothetical protein T35B1_04813 [Salinisphaera shabanensis T35B1]|uniref:Membrane lipoprotein n=1 Tax=Salinisphaera shabanensis E1L3A TaxID=1033802 RepID=U2ELF6_9GAMM|nr:hypothetical protein [Salinisphaera shabanensis]ERJ18765.1 membrane lipoprotein [Salinisphaera shabanensis E1L3A]
MAFPYLRPLALVVAGGCVLLSACASDPKPADLSPLDEPVDAFEAVGEPQRPGGASNREDNTLSTDIERLQNARKTYELERERLRAETSRRQAECRARDGSREVAIQDGSGDPNATYCEPASGSER